MIETLSRAAALLNQYRDLLDAAGLWDEETHPLREQTNDVLAEVADIEDAAITSAAPD